MTKAVTSWKCLPVAFILVATVAAPALSQQGSPRDYVQHPWRRGRDSNPRYGFRPYNGLANRRLQPLGHLSVARNLYLMGLLASSRKRP